MDAMNVRDHDGIVHRGLDTLLTDCLETMQEGWTFDRNPITCMACLSMSPATRTFAHELAVRVSHLAFIRCREFTLKTTLRKGDTLNYTQTFTFNCVVSVADDGSIVVKDAE